MGRYATHYLETIVGPRIELIPYTKEYVPLFNRWLQDPEMQQLVGTSAVTLEADYLFQEESARSTDTMLEIIKLIKTKTNREVIGDVDLFFNAEGEAEINIMVALAEQRRYGYASEALTLAMQYAIQKYGIRTFVAKIGKDNMASLRFFERHGFGRMNEEPNIFEQFNYEIDADDVPRAELDVRALSNTET